MIRIAVVSLLIASIAVNADDSSRLEDAAIDWLALVDSRQIEDAWNETDTRFKDLSEKSMWVSNMKRGLAQAGEVQSRSFLKVHKQSRYIDGYDGDLYLVLFDTEYSKTGRMIDTVFLAPDGERLAIFGFHRAYPMTRLNE